MDGIIEVFKLEMTPEEIAQQQRDKIKPVVKHNRRATDKVPAESVQEKPLQRTALLTDGNAALAPE